MQRRDFLKIAGATAACGLSTSAWAQGGARVAIVLEEPGEPVRWAAGQLQQALAAKQVHCAVVSDAEQAAGSDFVIAVARPGLAGAKGFAEPGGKRAAAKLTDADSLRMTPGRVAGTPAVLVEGGGDRGVVYALLELAERVESGADAMEALHETAAQEEHAANRIRSVGRYFCSEVEDKPWYYDHGFWRDYLDALVASRFNRFNLGFGLGYDFPRGVTGDYFHFVYPYMVKVPAFKDVRVVQLAEADGKRLAQPVVLSDAERQRNLATLKFIAAETGRRGLEFQLGIWTHAYQWVDSPDAYHRIEGLTPETHAAYCRDALAVLLRECPEIQGLTLRVHGESGIPEGDFSFWKTLFTAVTGCGRRVEIDMHSKGVNQKMIDVALATGMPVKLSPKYSAEHQSLGYQQADIRALEVPKPGEVGKGPFELSGGSRLFTRYGYADFLRAGRRYDVMFRLWPGTQRHLLSCDAEMAAAYGRTAHFCGTVGLDICEPLTFKGREGSGLPGGRCAYADERLEPRQDWRKFEAFYRLWGRKLYSPEAEPVGLQRMLRRDFQQGSGAMESAMAHASRVLPLLTSAHLASASNHAYWPELYDNMPVVLGSERSPYGDTPKPRCFGTVSPLDPQLFSTVEEHAEDLLAGRATGKYSPVEVAQWMEEMTAAAESALQEAREKTRRKSSPEFRRMEEDVRIEIGLGRFFAAKLRSGVLWVIFEKTGDERAAQQALARYRQARDAWAQMARRAVGVYKLDITYGDVYQRRGHWIDRLAGMDVDIAAMAEKLEAGIVAAHIDAAAAIAAATGNSTREMVACRHEPPGQFAPGKALRLVVQPESSGIAQARLWYRHVDQAERWKVMDMERGAGGFSAAIPGEYTRSPFGLEYYFEFRGRGGKAWIYPGFNKTLSSQPYYAVWRREA
jgi:hypothetical protein